MSTHRPQIDAVENLGSAVRVTFGCSCRAYTGDQTTGATEAQARARAAEHVRSHARIARGQVLPV